GLAAKAEMPEKQGDAERAPHTRPADRQRPHSTSHRRRAELHFRSGASEVQTRVLRARVDAGTTMRSPPVPNGVSRIVPNAVCIRLVWVQPMPCFLRAASSRAG